MQKRSKDTFTRRDAAARALLDGPLDAEAIARKAMAIAAKICVYTNEEVVVETLDATK